MRSFTFDALRRVGSLVDDPEQVSAMLSSVDAAEVLDGEVGEIDEIDVVPDNSLSNFQWGYSYYHNHQRMKKAAVSRKKYYNSKR
jgi:hypothetical protein